MKIKTSELTGAALDWAVDKAEGRIRPDGGYYCAHHGKLTRWSTDWTQAGPIIERQEISVSPNGDGRWWAHCERRVLHQYGPTPLVAAMRCYCCAKLGDEIDIPEELCQQQNS